MFLLFFFLTKETFSEENIALSTEKQITIYSNVETVIDTYPGTVLDYHLQFENYSTSYPCKLEDENFRFHQLQDDQIKFRDESFQNSYINGTYIGKVPQFMAIAKVGLGVVILQNSGTLLFIMQQENKYFIRSSYKYPSLSNVRFAFLELLEEKFIIITNQESWVLNSTFSNENIFSNHQLIKLDLQISTNNALKTLSFNKYLYVLFREDCLCIYKMEQEKLLIYQKIANTDITDFSILQEDSYHHILLLDKKLGLIFYQFNITSNKLLKNNEIKNLTPIFGEQIVIYKNRVLIISNSVNTEFIRNIACMILNLTENILSLIGTQSIHSQIRSVSAQEEHIFVFCSNTHYVLSWSVFKNSDISTVQHQQFIIPGLIQQFLSMNERRQLFLIGITRNNLLVQAIEYQNAQLICQLDSQIFQKTIVVNIILNQTQCKEVTDNSFVTCQQKIEYQITVLHPEIDSTTYQWMISLILLFGSLIIFLFVILICLFYKFDQIQREKKAKFQILDLETTKTTIRGQKSQVPEIEQDNQLHAPKASRSPDPISPAEY